MAGTKTYTVTDRAGPKVAGVRVKAGDELQLTEAQARAELAEGSIVPGGKADQKPAAEKGEKAADPFKEGSADLRHIQARARGLDAAPEEPAEEKAPPAGKGKAEGKASETKPPAEGGKPPAAPAA